MRHKTSRPVEQVIDKIDRPFLTVIHFPIFESHARSEHHLSESWAMVCTAVSGEPVDGSHAIGCRRLIISGL